MRYFLVDFFCGAGGTSLGFSKAGYTVLAGFDSDESACETYTQIRNSDSTHPRFLARNLFFETEGHSGGDGRQVFKDIKRLLKERNYKRSEDYLVFSISAPCQPFSSLSGKQVSDERLIKRERDSNLLLVCMRYIDEFRPDGVFIENVSGIKSSSSTKIAILDLFRSEITSKGYLFDSATVNASDFGVGQDRKREIGVAVRNDATEVLVIPQRDEASRKVTVEEVIGHFPALAAGERSNVPNHISRGLSNINLLRLKSLAPGCNNLGLSETKYGDLSLPCHNRLKEKSGKQTFADTYTRMHPDQLAPTITTRCNSISNGRFGHFDTRQIRGITPREAAALQSFPDDFVFYPLDQTEPAARLIGNAVPPRLSCFYASFIQQAMLGINVVDIAQSTLRRASKDKKHA